jgi:uncharacterized OsmC-like protein
MTDELTASTPAGAGEPRKAVTGTVRVDLERTQNKTFEVVFKNEEASFEFLTDEPSVRGGDSHGPTPLGYFIAGAASCLAMQYASLIKEETLPVEGLKVLARAHNDRERRIFLDVIYKVDLTGALTVADAKTLAEAATKRCYVENTLSRVIPMTTDVYLNGEKVTTIARHP